MRSNLGDGFTLLIRNVMVIQFESARLCLPWWFYVLRLFWCDKAKLKEYFH